MNKKAVKYVLIVSGIVLLLGLGIWGYKYIKNRNDDKKTNENKTDLKELANLTSYMTSTVTDDNSNRYTLNYYYNGYIPMGQMGQKCLIGGNYYGNSCSKYNYYLTIYVDNIKLKSSWMFYSYEAYSSKGINIPKRPKNLTTNVLNYKFLILSLSSYTYCSSYNGDYRINCNGSTNDAEKTYYPYTKVFDATTGDMIFAVPTNSNEKITITDTFDGISGSEFKNNMYLNSSAAIYYLKSNYTLTDGNNVEVHKVQFDDSYDNNKKYEDSIFAYTKGNIKTNS